MRYALRLLLALCTLVACRTNAADLYTFTPAEQQGSMPQADQAWLAKYRADPRIASSNPITIDEAALSDKTLTLRTPDGKYVTCVLTQAITTGIKYWAGSIDGDGDCAFSYAEGIVTGQFHAGGHYYSVGMPSTSTGILNELLPMPDRGDASPPPPDDAKTLRKRMRRDASPMDSAFNVIRILTVWTDSVVPLSEMASRTNDRINSLNSALTNSGVNVIAVNAGYTVVATLPNYGSDATSALAAFRVDPWVRGARNSRSADVSMLMMDVTSGGYAGLTPSAPTTYDTAFSVVDYQSEIHGQYVYAHEFGHQLGGQHQISGGANSSTNYPYLTPKAYQHGYGFFFDWSGGRACRRDIMSESMAACVSTPGVDSRSNIFSTPTYTWSGVYGGIVYSHVLGTTTYEDVARTMSEQSPTTAAFHGTPLPGAQQGEPTLMQLFVQLMNAFFSWW